MLDIKGELSKFSLDETNSVVIGFGILNALGLRRAKDIDLVINEEVFQRLRGNERLKEEVNEYGAVTLKSGIMEIGVGWADDSGFSFVYEDLLRNNQTTVVDGVRYLNLETLLKIKKMWAREKDLQDIAMIERYLEENK